MNCKYKAEVQKTRLPLAQINGNTDIAEVGWKQKSNSLLFCWIWYASKIRTFCISSTLRRRRGQSFFPINNKLPRGNQNRITGSSPTRWIYFLSKNPSSIYCHRWMLVRELGLRNGMELLSYKVCLLSKTLPMVFIFLYWFQEALATIQVLFWHECFSSEYFPSVFFWTQMYSWGIKSAMQQTKGTASKVNPL